MTRLVLMACCVLFASSVSTQSAAPKKAKPTPSIQKVNVSAQDLADVLSLNVYKFRMDLPKGQKFRLLIREFSIKGAVPKQHSAYDIEKSSDKPATLRVAFIRDDRLTGSAIFSRDEWMQYRVESTGCKPHPVGTMVHVPLVYLEPTRKTLIRSYESSEREKLRKTRKEIRLLTVVKSEPGKPSPSDTTTTFPRWELVIQLKK